MKLLDKLLDFGSTFRLLLFVTSLIIISIYIIRDPGQNRGAWVILIVGVAGTMREYRMWNESRP